MKYLIAFLLIWIPFTDFYAQETGTFVDKRDGHRYKTVKVGEQWWMSENLAFDAGEGCYLYDWRSIKHEKEGRIYTWFAAIKDVELEKVQDVCPDGWSLPSREDWQILIDELGGNKVAGKKLKPGGESGMNVIIPGSRFSDGTFRIAKSEIHFWSSTETGPDLSWCVVIFKVNDNVQSRDYHKGYVNAIRCIKEDL